MKQITFITAWSCPENNELSLILATLGGVLFAVHIDQYSRRMQQLYKTIEPELLSYIPGDKPLIEVTEIGARILYKEFKIGINYSPLTLVNVNNQGKSWYVFHTKEELESGTIEIIN